MPFCGIAGLETVITGTYDDEIKMQKYRKVTREVITVNIWKANRIYTERFANCTDSMVKQLGFKGLCPLGSFLQY